MNIIKNCRISNYVNCWRVKLDTKVYAIMPAHVALFKINNNWKTSQFLTTCDNNIKGNTNTDWHVPTDWLEHENIYNDICWKEIKNNDLQHFESTDQCLEDPIDVSLYFHQPHSYDGKIKSMASVGKIRTCVYESPNSKMLECVGVGFRGISGAVCVDNSTNIIGMLIRRGVDLGIHHVNLSNNIQTFSKNMSTVPRSIIMPLSIMHKHINNTKIEEITNVVS